MGVPDYNKKVIRTNVLLRTAIAAIPRAIFWRHRGLWHSTGNVYLKDGVHLNELGYHKYTRSIRGAVMAAERDIILHG